MACERERNWVSLILLQLIRLIAYFEQSNTHEQNDHHDDGR